MRSTGDGRGGGKDGNDGTSGAAEATAAAAAEAAKAAASRLGKDRREGAVVGIGDNGSREERRLSSFGGGGAGLVSVAGWDGETLKVLPPCDKEASS